MEDDFLDALITDSRSYARTHFDSALKVFSWRARSKIDSIRDSQTLIALDTNVLLLPYRAGRSSVDQILQAYRRLCDEHRLVVPGQVAREFAKNRPSVLGNTLQSLNDIRSRVVSMPKLEDYPLFRDLDSFAAAKDAADKASKAIDRYKRALGSLKGEAELLLSSDPISSAYSEVFDDSVVIDPQFSEAVLESTITFRNANAIPPGYKDASKTNGGAGDLIIWLTLLKKTASTGRDLFLVTEERKADWWHRVDGSPLFPRFELVDEYRRISGGGTVHLVSLSELLELLEVSDSVVLEIRNLESVIDPQGGAKLVRDGETLLIRGDAGYAAIQPIRQTMPPHGDESVEYLCWFSQDLEGFLRGQIQPTRDRCDSTLGTIAVGPFEIPWSGSSLGAGWFYYYEYGWSRNSPAKYELTVVPSGEHRWDQFLQEVFYRGN